MIKKTRDIVLQKFNKKNGYPADSEVIYGDTDSVMVKFGVDTVEEAIKYGKEASEMISTEFIKPIKLEFEKVNLASLRSGVLPVFADKQKKIRRTSLDEAGKAR